MEIRSEQTHIYAGEHRSRLLRVITEPLPAGRSVRLSFVTPTGKRFLTDALDTENGEATYLLPGTLLDAKGVLQAQIVVSEGETFCEKSAVYLFEVERAVEPGEATDETGFPTLYSLQDDVLALEGEQQRMQDELDALAARAAAAWDHVKLTGSLSMGRKDGTTVGNLSTAIGYNVEAPGRCAVAVGGATKAGGNFSLAEGYTTEATGEASHAEGYGAKATASSSHAEGRSTTAASNYQHAQGKYNVPDSSGVYAHIVGNGTDADHRSNCHTLDWQGNAWFAGDIRVGGNGFGTGRSITAAAVYVPLSISGTVNYTLAQDGATDTFTLKYFYESGTVVLEPLRGMVGETGTNIRTETCVRGGAQGRYLIWHSAGVDLLPQAYVMEQVWTPSEQDVFIGLIDTITGKVLFGNGNFVRAADETALSLLHG